MAESPHAGFDISLAQWSLHRSYFGSALEGGFGALVQTLATDPASALKGEIDPIDFPVLARTEFGIGAVEYVNTFYRARAGDTAYFADLKARADAHDVKSLLIMCDGLGMVGAADPAERARTVDNHKPWMDIAASLGCHAIRVNAEGEGDREARALHVADGLHRLAQAAAPLNLDVLVENHGGLSSDAAWLAGIMRQLNHPAVGTLPDFGNFRLLPNTQPRATDDPYYDRYLGVAELMPFARAVSAKSYSFDAAGKEETIDYARMLQIVVDAGYTGYVGIEYEGTQLGEFAGIRATQRLLEQVRNALHA